MKLLAIDTATEACSVALWQDGSIVEHHEVLGREHSIRLPLMVPALLAEAGLSLQQLDGLVCGIGPGSFAGVRIGVSYVKGLALGLDRPVVGITSLAMLAQAALNERPERVAIAAIDARMNEVYVGVYHAPNGLAVRLRHDEVCPPQAIHVPVDQPLVAAGSGWKVHGATMSGVLRTPPERIDADALPHARDALRLAVPEFDEGRGFDAAMLVPAYLRNRVALTQREQAARRDEASAPRSA